MSLSTENGTRPNPRVVIDLKNFFQKTGNRPIFTRKVLETAHTALNLVKEHAKFVTLIDCMGNEVVDEIGRSTRASLEQAGLRYNPHHILADEEASTREAMGQCSEENLDDWRSHVRFPVYVQALPKALQEIEWASIESSKASAAAALVLWNESRERHALIGQLRHMATTAQVTNIICIGQGFIRDLKDDSNQVAHCIQHFAAVTMAEELERIYRANGREVDEPIKILAQDITYTPECGKILDSLNLSHPFHMVDDPDALLAINSGSLIFSCCPGFPLHQIVGDLITEDPSIRPAALYWNTPRPEHLTSLDRAMVSRGMPYLASYAYMCADPISRRMYEVQKGYELILKDPSGFVRRIWKEENHPSFSWWRQTHFLARRVEQ